MRTLTGGCSTSSLFLIYTNGVLQFDFDNPQSLAGCARAEYRAFLSSLQEDSASSWDAFVTFFEKPFRPKQS